MELETLVVAASVVLVVGGGGLFFLLRHLRQKRDEVRQEEAVEAQLHLPPSLHPVIDTEICIGSLSCLKACPEGDILGVIDGAAHLIQGSNCIGHGKCALECPVDAIRLVFGTSERGVDLPEVNEFFESSRPGVHIVGELGGMGLIKNAMTQGLQAARFLASTLDRRSGDGVDVVIVGAGPAGIATALGCRSAGLSFRVLEQGTLGGTVAQYPRQKVVMTEKLKLPIYGNFGKRLISKEELLESFAAMIGKADLRIEEGVQVTGVAGEDGDFRVQTSRGEVAGRKVVLAIGRRGTPRKLGAPGEELAKVTYRLVDPRQYAGTKVLVVGGGDAALEAAIQLAQESDAEVAISYRGPAFGRCRPANKDRIAALIESRRIRALMSSEVVQITPETVALTSGGASIVLPNDFVIVSIGGELPTEFLGKAGVDVKRHHGEVPDRNKGGAPRHDAVAREAEDRTRNRLAWGLFALGALIIAGLTIKGWDYYTLPEAARRKSELHESLRPAGDWGHGIGIVATLFMMSNFLYAIRKRWSLLKGTGTIRTWLTFHMFVGFMSPLVIAFHAAFKSNNGLATATAAALLIVVGTGVIGRYLYGLVPQGQSDELAALLGRWERLKGRVEPMLDEIVNPAPVRALLDRATAPHVGGSLIVGVLALPFQSLAVRLRLLSIRGLFAEPADYRDFHEALLQLLRLRTQVGFYKGLKRLLSGWRVFHAVLAVFLVFVIAAHIALSLYLGYGWVFF